MNSVSLTGQDTIVLGDPITGGRILNDLADGDAVKLTFPNDLAVVKSSKNGNVLYAFNNTGLQTEAEIRIVLGSADDKFLNSRLQEMKNDFSAFSLVSGSFIKRVGDGQGNISSVVYQCTGGVFKRQVDAKTSAEGDTEQSVAIYTINFGNANRSIQ